MAFRYKSSTAKHLYVVEVLTGPGKRESWDIEAANRTQAASVARRCGALEVCSIYMEG